MKLGWLGNLRFADVDRERMGAVKDEIDSREYRREKEMWNLCGS